MNGARMVKRVGATASRFVKDVAGINKAKATGMHDRAMADYTDGLSTPGGIGDEAIGILRKRMRALSLRQKRVADRTHISRIGAGAVGAVGAGQAAAAMDKKAEAAYFQGFADACASVGADPERLCKVAGPILDTALDYGGTGAGAGALLGATGGALNGAAIGALSNRFARMASGPTVTKPLVNSGKLALLLALLGAVPSALAGGAIGTAVGAVSGAKSNGK